MYSVVIDSFKGLLLIISLYLLLALYTIIAV